MISTLSSVRNKRTSLHKYHTKPNTIFDQKPKAKLPTLAFDSVTPCCSLNDRFSACFDRHELESREKRCFLLRILGRTAGRLPLRSWCCPSIDRGVATLPGCHTQWVTLPRLRYPVRGSNHWVVVFELPKLWTQIVTMSCHTHQPYMSHSQGEEFDLKWRATSPTYSWAASFSMHCLNI